MLNKRQTYRNLDQEKLVLLAQNNDYNALEELIKRVQKKVYTSFAYLKKDEENLSDLTQEALIKMAKGIPKLKSPKAFNSWLNQIIMNLFYDELRKKCKKPEICSMDSCEDNTFFQIPDKLGLPVEKAMLSETDRIIKEKICTLPDNFKVAIVLRELQGLSYDEIAAATNTSVGTVKSRIARAREKLQCSLKNYI